MSKRNPDPDFRWVLSDDGMTVTELFRDVDERWVPWVRWVDTGDGGHAAFPCEALREMASNPEAIAVSHMRYWMRRRTEWGLANPGKLLPPELLEVKPARKES